MMNLLGKIKKVGTYIKTATIQTTEILRLAKAKGEVDFEMVANILKEYYGIDTEIKMIRDPLNIMIPGGLDGAYMVEENVIVVNKKILLFALNTVDNDIRVLLTILHEICHVKQLEEIGMDEFKERMYYINADNLDMKIHDENELEIEANAFAIEHVTRHLHLLRKHRQ